MSKSKTDVTITEGFHSSYRREKKIEHLRMWALVTVWGGSYIILYVYSIIIYIYFLDTMRFAEKKQFLVPT